MDYAVSGEKEKSCGKCGWTWHVTRAMVNAPRHHLDPGTQPSIPSL
ncbi:hypothetical protein PV797_12630 [Clostridiaceae bacterium M8S5]|nr:hypothetical protein PV797_12630 [Clostridiaceae bacterium M8S5]